MLRESLPDDLGARFDVLVRDAAQRRDAKQAVQDAAVDLILQQSKNLERARAQSLVDRIESARRIGQAAVVTAALTMDERRLAGATKAEIAQALTLRCDAIRVTRVKEILGCTDTELKRWSADGRLPVLFRRKMPISSAGKTLDVRHWSLVVVMDATADIATWRDEDAEARRKRHK